MWHGERWCHNVAMHSDGRGRPRLERSRTARQDRTRGDPRRRRGTVHHRAATPARRLVGSPTPSGCGRRSLYHHFATKDDILDALLTGTVDEPLRLAAELIAEVGPRAPRLHALAVVDATQLCNSTWNLGALYLLPELRVDRFERVSLAPQRTSRSVSEAGGRGDRRMRRPRRRRRTARSGSSSR